VQCVKAWRVSIHGSACAKKEPRIDGVQILKAVEKARKVATLALPTVIGVGFLEALFLHIQISRVLFFEFLRDLD
jgi:hypothetical protein